MSDGNNFLSNYGKGSDSAGKSGYKYEQKSSFIMPPKKKGSGPASPKQPKLIGPIIAGAAVLVLAVVLILILANRGVKVIDLTGWTYNDASLWAGEKGVMLQVEEQYNDTYEEGVIFAQSVAEGERVKKGDFIKVTVSLGHDLSVTLPLPDIMSMTMDEIEAWAKANYMTKVRITSEYSDTVPAGNVIRYEINDKTVVDEVRRDTPIYVIVSKGAEDPSTVQITVPDFKAMALSACYAFANENGIVLTVKEEFDDYAPKGSIISQSVKAEKKINKGEEIILVISKGKKITMPDFSKYSKEMASTVAGQLGITFIQTEWYSSAPAGTFLSQSIKAGSVYEDGEVLELKYSQGKINVPSFEYQADIEEWADGVNQKGANIKISVNTVMSSFPRGKITYQDKVNVLVGPGETINITVSAGMLIYTPDFVGLGKSYEDAVTREIAIEMCEALNIIPNFVEEHNPDYLPGEIWYQSINAGTEISEGTVITLKYNPNNKWSDVPNFIGMTRAVADNSSDKLKIVFEGTGSTVIAQSIPENTRVAYGTKIVLTLGN